MRPIESLIANPRNARTHDDKQIAQIAASIHQFGYVNPILTDEERVVIAGHGRLAAAALLGMKEVPTIMLSGLSRNEKRALAIADNRLPEKAGWNIELLAEELKVLSEIEVEFDVSLTGFDTVDIDAIIDAADGAVDPAADAVPPVGATAAPVSRLGDLWQLGPHRLLCGDATDPTSYDRLLSGEMAQLVFTDPPYNVPIAGHVGGNGRVRHPEFVMASGEMSAQEFLEFLTRILRNFARGTIDGAILYICMDWRHYPDLFRAALAAGLEPKNLCVWAKPNAGMGTFYRSQHELILVVKNGTAPHINNFGLGEHGRYRTNVWSYPGGNTFRPGRAEELAMHPTVKPVALVADAIKDCSHRGGVVLDPFAGSGTTVIAAEKTGRIARVMELDPRYVDVVIRRWQDYTGGTARLGESGKTFAEIASSRLQQASPAPPVTAIPAEAAHER